MECKNKLQIIQGLLPYIIIFLIIICLPDIITWINLPDGLVFNGTFVNIDDTTVYLSAIRQGSEGKWLFTSQFSPEQVPGIFSYFPYLITGKLQSIFGGNVFLWYQILRIGAGLFSLIALTKLVEEIFPLQSFLQKTSSLLFLFSSGISWLLLIWSNQIPRFASDLLIPEWSLISSSLSAPHFLLGIGFQAAFYTKVNRLILNTNKKNLTGLLIIGTCLGLSYPFLIPVDGLVLASYLTIQSISHRKIPWKKVFYLFNSTVPMIILLLYYGFFIPQDPDLANTLLLNNQVDSPNLIGILTGYGLLLFFAFYAGKSFASNNASSLIANWIIINVICLYLPINFSGRFVLGLFIPICLIAAQGIENIIRNHPRKESVRSTISTNSKRWILIFLTFPSSFLFLLFTVIGGQTNQGYPYYYQENEFSAVQWLAEQTNEEDLILANYPIGNLIPRFSSARVFQGHLNLTIELEEKMNLFRKFWDPATDQAWRQNFIDKWGITYIYLGQFEQNLIDGVVTPPGKLVYDEGGVMIFSLYP